MFKGNLLFSRLADILLCLEDVLRNEEGVIGGECLYEMRDHRK